MKTAQPTPRLTWSDLSPDYLDHLISVALLEDIGGLGLRRRPRAAGDRSTASLQTLQPAAKRKGTNPPRSPLPASRDSQATAHLVARAKLTTCGLQLIPRILAAYTPKGAKKVAIKFHTTDARQVAAGAKLATLTGDPRILLPAERIMLNFLQYLGGIATTTRRHVDALGKTKTKLLDTRKTTPGYRMLEKYAVACGGAWNHRLGLFDRVMLKDNHLALLGSDADLAAAVKNAKKTKLPVEVEVDRLDQIPPVLAAGADIILLDNMPPATIRRAVKLIGKRALTEASGNITLKNIRGYANLGLTYISTGALVHQSTWIDIGLDWQ